MRVVSGGERQDARRRWCGSRTRGREGAGFQGRGAAGSRGTARWVLLPGTVYLPATTAGV